MINREGLTPIKIGVFYVIFLCKFEHNIVTGCLSTLKYTYT